MGIGKTPRVERQNPEADAALAAAQAAQTANQQMATRRRGLRNSSLLATGAKGVAGPASSVLASAYGKETLGG